MADPLTETLLTLLAGLVMLIGLVGIVVPVLPGIILIWLAALAYALLVGWGASGPWLFALITLLGAAGAGSEIWLTGAGARAAGASMWSVAAGVVLAVLGLIFFNLLGAVVGLVVGTLLAEYYRLRDWRRALTSAGGTAAGCGVSYGVKMLLGLGMIGAWVAWVILR
jgi:uncharacterized protein YqgC (DUF456 family)